MSKEMNNIKTELADMKAALSSDSTPANMKPIFKATIEKLEKKLQGMETEPAKRTSPKGPKVIINKVNMKAEKKRFENKDKAPAKKKKSAPDLPKFFINSLVKAPVTKGKVAELTQLNFDEDKDSWIYTITWKDERGETLTYESGHQALTLVERPDKKKKNTAGMTDEECRELIAKEKAKSAKAKSAAAKRAKKPESKKNVERIEKATEVVEKSIKERKASGKQPTIAEIKALIKEHEDAIKMLKKQLAQLGKKTEKERIEEETINDNLRLHKGSFTPDLKKEYIFVQTWNGEGYSDDNKIIYRGKFSKDDLFDQAQKIAENSFGQGTGTEKLDNGWGVEDDEDYGTIQFFEITDKKKQFGIVIFTNVNEVKVLPERKFKSERAAVAELYLESGDYSAEDSENGKGRNFFSQEDIDYNHSVEGDDNESDYQFEIINPKFNSGGSLPLHSVWESPITQKERDKEQKNLVPMSNKKLDFWVKASRFKKTIEQKMENLGISSEDIIGASYPKVWNDEGVNISENFKYGSLEFTYKGKDYFAYGDDVFNSNDLKELLDKSEIMD